MRSTAPASTYCIPRPCSQSRRTSPWRAITRRGAPRPQCRVINARATSRRSATTPPCRARIRRIYPAPTQAWNNRPMRHQGNKQVRTSHEALASWRSTVGKCDACLERCERAKSRRFGAALYILYPTVCRNDGARCTHAFVMI